MDKPTCKTPGCDNPPGTRSGLCRPCRSKAYKVRHADEIRAYARAYNAKNRVRVRGWAKAWELANPGRANETRNARRLVNGDSVREAEKAWRLANPEQFRATRKANRLAHPVRDRQWSARKRAQKLGLAVTEVDYVAILTEYGMVCHICGEDIPDFDHLDFDHVIPLAKSGAHATENIRPSHSLCNMQKGSRLI